MMFHLSNVPNVQLLPIEMFKLSLLLAFPVQLILTILNYLHHYVQRCEVKNGILCRRRVGPHGLCCA